MAAKSIGLKEFIRRSVEVHGDYYCYSKVEYKNLETEVEVICPLHGSFWVKPRNHIYSKNGLPGGSCKKCYRESKRAKAEKEFFTKARKVHGDKYDYSEVKYFNSATKVKIICPVHGEFFQSPEVHVSGSGCYLCGRDNCKLKRDDFINRASRIHKGKYQYPDIDFTSVEDYIPILCPVHGEYMQKIKIHLNGHGCPRCQTNKKLSHEDFIRKSKETHGDFYDYSNTVFKNTRSRVTISCPIHGDFRQTASSHLSGRGCTLCANEKKLEGRNNFYESTKPCYLYVIRIEHENDSWIKIGLAKSVNSRIKRLLKEMPDFNIKVIRTYTGPARECYIVEGDVLYRSTLTKYRKTCWSWGGNTECYAEGELDAVLSQIDSSLNKVLGVFPTTQ